MSTWRERVDDRLGDPIWWNDVLQLVKTVLAAVVAWVIAASLLELPQPFLAPWAALLVVHATVYRTFSKGMQQVAATVVAVLLASFVGQALGLSTWAIALLLVVALVLGAVPWLGAEATTIATTSRFMTTSILWRNSSIPLCTKPTSIWPSRTSSRMSWIWYGSSRATPTSWRASFVASMAIRRGRKRSTMRLRA